MIFTTREKTCRLPDRSSKNLSLEISYCLNVYLYLGSTEARVYSQFGTTFSTRMDYLRNLGSAAVSTLVQKSGINLPFTLGPKVASCETLWVLYDATKRVQFHTLHLHYELTLPASRTTAALSRSLNTTLCTRSTNRRSRSPRMPSASFALSGIPTSSNSWTSSNRTPPFSS